MRKQVLFGAALLALGTAVVSSCSKDEVVIDNTPGVETPAEDGVQELILNMNSAGDGLTTRGGRPLYSSEAAQEIDRVVIKIIQRGAKGSGADGEIVRSITIKDWQTVSKQYTVGGHGRMYTFKLTQEQKVAEGTYEIYAIGYTSTGSSYDFGTFEGKVNGKFQYSDATQTLNKTTEAEEVFAGSIKSITVDTDGNFVLTNDNPENNVLTLHRQVAGVIGYYSNIPVLMSGGNPTVLDKTKYDTYVKGLKLRLVSSRANSKLIFAGFNSGFTETGEDYKFVVNGSTPLTKDAKFAATKTGGNDANVLYEIKLADWFINGDVNKDGMLDINDNRDKDGNRLDNWISPYSSIENLEFEEGSVFAGKFVIPFQKLMNSPKTLELQLVAGNDLRHNDDVVYAAGSIIRSWTINLSSTDPQVEGPDGARVHARTVSEATGELEVSKPDLEESANSYSIVRNHLYTVGTKGTNDYNPDTDEPQDLSKGQELILKVNDNWELIHKMEVE